MVHDDCLVGNLIGLIPGFEFARASWTAFGRTRVEQGNCIYLIGQVMVDSFSGEFNGVFGS